MISLFADSFPAQLSLPELTGPVLYNSNTDAFYFQCNIAYPVCNPDNGARFEVRFWAEDESTKNTVAVFMDVNCTQPYAALDYLFLRGHLGKALHCSVQSYWLKDGGPPADSVTYHSSNSYWMGIWVSSYNSRPPHKSIYPSRCYVSPDALSLQTLLRYRGFSI